MLPYYFDEIAPALLAGKKVLVVGEASFLLLNAYRESLLKLSMSLMFLIMRAKSYY